MIQGLVRVWSGLDTNAAWEVAWAGSAPDRGTTETSCRLERLHLGCREQKGGRLGEVDRHQWRQEENYRQHQQDSELRGAGSIPGDDLQQWRLKKRLSDDGGSPVPR
ncbi:hypothetical protein NDU88_003215 [Pleurodeles waltl]|uniref:Uncharacterized protein n=1 Tax=Pleurodeles waltl TaxID=8319 RepID=A0AAV7M4R5_PLEWA|nr:hypothetical protein NDU88_003215 [Pleurodeles waltl]